MTTEDLINALQKADPTGKCHVRVGDGIVLWAERKPGYWDGPYQYHDKDRKKLIISTKGDKVDLTTTSFEDWIWSHEGDYSDIEFDFTYCDNESAIEGYKKQFEKISQECKECIKKIRSSKK